MQLEKAVEMYYGKDTATNPFLESNSMRINVVAVYGGGSKMQGEPLFYYEPDEKSATHIFHGDDAHENRVLHLRGGALKLLMLIIFSSSPKTDRVRIYYDRYMKRMKVKSKQTFYNCIKELVDVNIITHYRGNIYWTNPVIFCAGSRHKKYPGKVDVVKKHYMYKHRK